MTITDKMVLTVAEYDGYKVSDRYELPQVVYEKGNHQVEYIKTSGEPNEFFQANMGYTTSMDKLHPVAVNVYEQLTIIYNENNLKEVYRNAHVLFAAVRRSLIVRPENGVYFYLFNAVYEGLCFIKNNGNK